MEVYVTFEQAKLLKELGFNWCCYDRYNVNKEIEPNVIYNRTEVDSDMLCFDVNGHNIGDISAPTLSLAQKWLREVKGTDIIVLKYATDYVYTAYFKDKIVTGDLCETYEQSLLMGISEVLKIFKRRMR